LVVKVRGQTGFSLKDHGVEVQQKTPHRKKNNENGGSM